MKGANKLARKVLKKVQMKLATWHKIHCFLCQLWYRGGPGMLEPTLDFNERHYFHLSSTNYGWVTFYKEPRATPISSSVSGLVCISNFEMYSSGIIYNVQTLNKKDLQVILIHFKAWNSIFMISDCVKQWETRNVPNL